MKKEYIQPRINIVAIDIDATLMDTSIITGPTDDGAKNGTSDDDYARPTGGLAFWYDDLDEDENF